jgi:hypothetical protein
MPQESFQVTKANSDANGESLKGPVQSSLTQLHALIRRGQELLDLLARDSTNAAAVSSTRIWQEQCGAAIHQLSGGSKAHWLARAFSEAFLMRSVSGQALEKTPPEKIVERLLSVLQQAVASLLNTENPPMVTTTMEPTPRRFEFVHNAELRPVLEQAYAESRQALEQGEFETALRTSCGILEAMVTDALEQKELNALADFAVPAGKVSGWDFETRLAVAEKAGLIRGGWVRLTEAARKYRETEELQVGEQDARRASQVLNVIMRDLNPGR